MAENNNQIYQHEEESTIQLTELWSMIWNHKWWYVLSVFVCLFSVWLSLYAVLAALGGSAIACVIGAIACALEGIFLQALFCAGASFVCAGLCIWFALLCVPIAKGFMHIMACLWIKCVRRREKA